MPAESFVIDRMGTEVLRVINKIRGNGGNPSIPQPYRQDPDPSEIGKFRKSGEIHQWMYDRFSLGKLMEKAGFSDIRAVKANESQIPGFETFHLDTNPDGSVRKPDSLFMEAKSRK